MSSIEGITTQITSDQRDTIVKAIRAQAKRMTETLDEVERLKRNRQGIPDALVRDLRHASSSAALTELADRLERGEVELEGDSTREIQVTFMSYIDVWDSDGEVVARLTIEDEEFQYVYDFAENFDPLERIEEEVCYIQAYMPLPKPLDNWDKITPAEIVLDALKADGR